jgi:hypothetical protein
LAFGASAGNTLKTAQNSIMIGVSAMSGSVKSYDNIAIGQYTLANMNASNAQFNIAIGHLAGMNAVAPNSNVLIGPYSGYDLTTGKNNIAIGLTSANAITSGSNNICIGIDTGKYITTGYGNMLFGNTSGNRKITGQVTSDMSNTLLIDNGNGDGPLIEGNFLTGDVRVRGTLSAGTITDLPDYVFENDYKLMTIDELEQYVKTEKHLPGVLDAETVKENGFIDIVETNMKLLEKIEELTLYVIQLNKRVKELESKVG